MIKNKTHSKVDIAAFQQEKDGNHHCGDSYMTLETDDYFLCALADGLGSGEAAHQSSQKAMDAAAAYHHENVPFILEKCNKALMMERGVVLTVMKVNYKTKEVVYGNIGNISSYFFTDKSKFFRPIPAPGYLSGRKFQYRLESFPFREEMTFILHSDGVSFSNAEKQSILKAPTPEEAIHQLADKAGMNNDDITILIGRIS
ncbi:PP2C family serine/threonine-protein phosphatase [Alteribacillus sp. HJP-4]|uniref:PP2C family serine/threonine-protein phosphatase n=1 Tax=Alteribacillus sp. HJP-4 TaxID=2775394 RepID=UPI0035CD2FD4